jgi:hypothetical protein
MKCTKWEWLVVCEKLMKCLPELDSGAFQTFGIEIWERHRLKAGVTGKRGSA